MQVNSSRHQSRTAQKCLQQLRLVTAEAILCNLTKICFIQKNNADLSDIAELSDDYALRILLNWLAFKYDFPAYPSNIPSEKDPAHYIFESWSYLSDEYPFNRPVYTNTLNMAYQKGFRLLEDLLQPDLCLLGNLFELINHTKLVVSKTNASYIENRPKRSLSGQFYTPPWVVNYCFHAIEDQDLMALIKSIKQTSPHSNINKNQARIKIIDPSCGSGNFLLGALDWFQEYDPTKHQLFNFVTNSLFGIDIDGRAVSLCRLSLVLKLAGYFRLCSSPDNQSIKKQLGLLMQSLRCHIQVGDSIVYGALQKPGEYDIVATNPPYISHGSRNQSKLSAAQMQFLKMNYPNSSEYKVRLHSIFQDLCLRLAKENGKIVLLLPDAFLNGRYYVKLRNHLLKNTQIESLSELPEQIIPHATVGRWCIPVYRKTSTPPKNYNVNLHSFSKDTIAANQPAPDRTYKAPVNILISKDHNRLRMLFTNADTDICKIIDSLDVLGSTISGHTGIRSKVGQAAIVSNKQENNAYKRGLSSGSNISRYDIRWNDMWINTSKELLFAGGFDEQLNSQPKILMRQTGDKIISALDVSGLYHLNNIHSFCSHKKDSKIDLDYVTALMNSSCWLYLYQLKSRESDRALAQIDIEMIESMPLPQKNENIITKISILSQSLRLSKKIHADGLQGFINRAIDSLTYSAYGFSKDQIDHIENYCRTKLPFPDKLPDVHEIDQIVTDLISK